MENRGRNVFFLISTCTQCLGSISFCYGSGSLIFSEKNESGSKSESGFRPLPCLKDYLIFFTNTKVCHLKKISLLHDSFRKSEIFSPFSFFNSWNLCYKSKTFLTGFIFCSLDPDPWCQHNANPTCYSWV